MEMLPYWAVKGPMIRESVTPQDLCDFMNELIKLDPEAIYNLIRARVPVNDGIANHPTAQVCAIKDQPERYDLGLLGVLNGLFGSFDDQPYKGWGCIVYTHPDPNLTPITAENSYFRVWDRT